MKVKVKAPFFDANGIHKVGEIVEVKEFRPELMELVEEKKVKVEKAVAKTPKKTTRTKKEG